MILGTRDTLPPETTLRRVYMIKLQTTVTRFNSGRHIVFLLNVLLRMRLSEKLSLLAETNCLHG